MSESTAQTTATTDFPPVPVPTGYLGGLTPEAFEALPAVLRRFLTYTQFETASDMHAAPGVRPSTAADRARAPDRGGARGDGPLARARRFGAAGSH